MTTRTMYKIFGCMAAAALLAGCSKEPYGPEGGDSSAPILPGATVAVSAGSQAHTRADLSGVVDGPTFPANTTGVFFVTAYRGSAEPTADWSGGYFNNIAVNSGSESALSFATAQYYPANGDKLYFYAYSPSVSAADYKAGNGATPPQAIWTVDGKRDIMHAKEVTGIAKGANPANQPQPAFAFTHKLMQVKFKIVKDASFDDNVKLTSLTVIGIKNTATLDLNSGTVTFSGSGELPVYSDASGQAITATAAGVGDPLMFEPGETFNVRAVAGGMTFADTKVTLSGPRAGKAGVSHEVTLTFSSRSITSSATIAEWQDGGEGTTGEDAYPLVMSGHTIVLKDLSGKADPLKYPTHEPWTATPAHREALPDDNVSGYNTFGERFQVASSDAVGKDGSAVTMTWYEASGTADATYNPDGYSACAEYSEEADKSDKGSWRLPTIQELALIYEKNKRGYLTAANLPSSSDIYWSATEHSSFSNVAWVVRFSNGRLSNYKSNTNRVRCVRDL